MDKKLIFNGLESICFYNYFGLDVGKQACKRAIFEKRHFT
jgi:hypothetical protein